MFKQIKKIYVITGFLYLGAFVFLMLNVFHTIFNILFSATACGATVLLTIILYKRYKIFKLQKEEEKQIIVMEMLSNDEAVVTPFSDKQLKVLKREKFSLFLPIIFSVLVSAFFLFSFVWQIIKMF